MRERILPYLVGWAMLVAAPALVADDGTAGPSNTAKITITFTVPERIKAAASIATSNSKTPSACLTTSEAAAFAVNALISDGLDWQLAPVGQRPRSSTPGECDDDLAMRFDINKLWYDSSRVVTLLISPL